jgi:Zn ribbon nucleic-acid-binding protein
MSIFRRKQDNRARIFRIVVILVLLFVVATFAALRYSDAQKGPDTRVAFAECLTSKQAKFYGAFWCPHCQAQKKLLGSKAMDKVDYIECAVPGNTQGQTQECQDAKIESYPTWVFADGTRTTGEQSFEALGEKTGCTPP